MQRSCNLGCLHCQMRKLNNFAVAAIVMTGIFLASTTPAQAVLGPGGTQYAHVNNVTLDIEDEQPFTYNSTASLYTTTTNLHVTATKPYGFNLTMQATSNALTNTLNSSHQIPSLTTNNQALGTNQWGYTLTSATDTLSHSSRFNPIPTTSTTPTTATILDVAPANPTHSSNTNPNPNPCTSLTNCTTKVLYAANLNPATLPTGTYQTTITYTVTAKPAPKPVVPNSICRSGDAKSDCKVDLDKNLIPVKYTGTNDYAKWTTIANPEDTTNPGDWYDYGQKHWANAVTIKPDKLAKYQGKTATLDEADVLGYYTYVPRYAYEVMRRDGTDKPVKPENFNIVFETANTPKKHPAKCTTGANRDYRTACNLDRNYPTTTSTLNSTTWSTHPAFTFGAKELNGIWVGKFETTGTSTNPTILPNQRHLSGNDPATRNLGLMYATATRLGIKDPANTYGDQANVAITQNSHHLDTFSSRMSTNSDWGAIAYLSASHYGAGHGNVQMNTQYQNRTLDGRSSSGTTGCGPSASGDKNTTYTDGGTLGTQSACSTSNLQRAYNGSLGQLASTTNNTSGIYDLAGGGYEYAAAARTTDNISGQATGGFNANTPHRPYANLYYHTDSFNSCTYESCGGQAMHETNNGDQWHGQYAYFASSDYPWVYRGGSATWSYGGVFYADAFGGNAYYSHSLRVVLAPVK